MKVIFAGAGPGDPELLTVKVERLLRRCRICIYAGSLVSQAVLDLLPVTAERHDSALLTKEEIVEICRDGLSRGIEVVRLHSGEPSIFGAIGEQMNELDKAGIPYEVLPGISSFQAAAAALKVELTAPEISQTVILSRVAGRTPVPEEQSLSALAATGSTLCLFLSVHAVAGAAATLAASYGAQCPAAVVYHASRDDQQILSGTLSDIAEKVRAAGIKKTAIILAGHALSRSGPASRLYDAAFSHEYREAKESM